MLISMRLKYFPTKLNYKKLNYKKKVVIRNSIIKMCLSCLNRLEDFVLVGARNAKIDLARTRNECQCENCTENCRNIVLLYKKYKMLCNAKRSLHYETELNKIKRINIIISSISQKIENQLNDLLEEEENECEKECEYLDFCKKAKDHYKLLQDIKNC